MAVFQTILAILYPVFVYIGLGLMEPRQVAFCMGGILVVRLLLFAPSRLAAYTQIFWIPVIAVAGTVMFTAAFNHPLSLLLTPVVISLGLLGVFGTSLLQAESIVERLAKLHVPDLSEPELAYCRRVTGVWCVFFLLNASVALALAMRGSLELWTFYVGFFSYVLVGTIFFLEYLYRQWRFRRYTGAPADFILKRIFPPRDDAAGQSAPQSSPDRPMSHDSESVRRLQEIPMKPCVLIPVYNHGAPLEGVLADLIQFELPCLLVDDGSDEETKATLEIIKNRYPWVEIQTRARNGGKGAALKDGYRFAHSLGFSHVVQLDADGQHDTNDIPRVLELLRAHPNAMVLIDPIFENAPKLRKYGRLISRFWAWIECCSLAIHDPLCGYRGLPLPPLIAILDRVRCGDRMDFDPEIAVRLVWEGVPVINLPSTVLYYPEGISHFNLLWDNVLISWSHTRLVFGMLRRLPSLLGRRVEVRE